MKSKLPYVRSYQDLIVYQKSVKLAVNIYKITKNFPKEEAFSLTDQIRRSSRSVGAQIAEAWAKRRYLKHFISKLTDAAAEINETEHWLDTAYRCEYLTLEITEELTMNCHELNKLIAGMINKANLFCKSDH